MGVPEGWHKRSLEDVAQIRTGVAKGKKNIPDPVRLPYLRVANVQDGYLDLSEMKLIEVSAKNIDRYLLENGDVLLTEGGDFDKLGRGAIWKGQVENCLHQNHVFAVRVNRAALLPEFLSAQTGSGYGKSYFLSIAKRSTNLASINSTQLKQFPVIVPPLPEQRKIAEILSVWDRAIEVSEALLATARRQKRALMQALLTGHRRFPEFKGEAWKEVRLGEVATVDHNSLGAKTPADYEFNYISLSNVEPGRIVQPLAHIAFKDAPSRARRIVKTGDLLVSTVRPNLLGFARVTNEYKECIASTGFAVVSPNAPADGAYLFHYLFSHHMASQFHALVVGSNYPAINSSDVRKLKILLPPIAEQQKIGQVLDDCEKEVAILAYQIRHLRTEKKALMQQLLTGKRRVVV